MAKHEDKSNFSLIRFSKNVLFGVVGGFIYGFSVGLGEDNSYHFAVIVGAHTILAGLFTILICSSINSSSLFESLPRLKIILAWSIASGSFSGMNSFIANTSPYIHNTEIMGNNAVSSFIAYTIIGALVGYISTLFAYKRKRKAT